MAGLTPTQMLQEFQVHYDKVDADGLPRMYPEEVFLFLNDAQLEYCKQAREALEQNTQLTEDLRTLVVDGLISPIQILPTQVTYPLSQIREVGAAPGSPFIPHYYTMMGEVDGQVGDKQGKVNLREVTHNEWQTFLLNPHTTPRPSLCPYRFTHQGIVVGKPTTLQLGDLSLTVVKFPQEIGPTTSCELTPQLHRPLCMRAVELAVASINRGNQATQNQD